MQKYKKAVSSERVKEYARAVDLLEWAKLAQDADLVARHYLYVDSCRVVILDEARENGIETNATFTFWLLTEVEKIRMKEILHAN